MSGPANSNESGPLAGVRIVEMAGLGPVPLAGYLLSRLGAEIIRIERNGSDAPFLTLPDKVDIDRLGRAVVAVDLKSDDGKGFLLDLCRKADVLLEGFRPGVMERLGLGPDMCHAVNPGLIYGRMTGFGQNGPLAQRAGHDLTYLAMTGVLGAIGSAGGKPVPPLNLIADYGGGTMFLITGVLSALIERSHSGRGQVVDAAMIDGVSNLASLFFAMCAAGLWREGRGSNLLDSGAPFYDTYETGDGEYVAVACLEPRFFAEFARLLPLEPALAGSQYDREKWPELRAAIAKRLFEKTRDEWASLFAETDACVAPVLNFDEAPRHPHNQARSTFSGGDAMRPSPAPRFSRTPSGAQGEALFEQAQTASILAHYGITPAAARELLEKGAIAFRS